MSGLYGSDPEAIPKMPNLSREYIERDYSRRAVYVDYLKRWAWSEDSLGRKTAPVRIPDIDQVAAIEDELRRALDQNDPIPSSARAYRPTPTRHLRLIP